MTLYSPPYAPPLKRSITIAGHATSISLEPIFWDAVEAAARGQQLPLSALIAQIDAGRIAVNHPPNLASAIRTWVLADLQRTASSTLPASTTAIDPDANVSQYR